MKYELWENDEKTSVAFFPVDENYEHHIGLLEPSSKLIRIIEADNWEKAMSLYHEKMGWSEYKPLE